MRQLMAIKLMCKLLYVLEINLFAFTCNVQYGLKVFIHLPRFCLSPFADQYRVLTWAMTRHAEKLPRFYIGFLRQAMLR